MRELQPGSLAQNLMSWGRKIVLPPGQDKTQFLTGTWSAASRLKTSLFLFLFSIRWYIWSSSQHMSVLFQFDPPFSSLLLVNVSNIDQHYQPKKQRPNGCGSSFDPKSTKFLMELSGMEVVIDTTSLGLRPVTWAHPKVQLLLSHMPRLTVPRRLTDQGSWKHLRNIWVLPHLQVMLLTNLIDCCCYEKVGKFHSVILKLS